MDKPRPTKEQMDGWRKFCVPVDPLEQGRRRNIVELEEHREVWISCLCLCVNCSHRWTAVVHESRMEKLECGDCGEMKGAAIKEFPVVAE